MLLFFLQAVFLAHPGDSVAKDPSPSISGKPLLHRLLCEIASSPPGPKRKARAKAGQRELSLPGWPLRLFRRPCAKPLAGWDIGEGSADSF